MDKFGTVFQEQYIPPQRHKYGKVGFKLNSLYLFPSTS